MHDGTTMARQSAIDDLTSTQRTYLCDARHAEGRQDGSYSNP